MPTTEQPELLKTYEGKRKTIFLGWDRPLCEAAADYLAAGWNGGTLDLTGVLVLVPTRQSGRKLRETLAAKISAGGGAVIPPTVTTPDALAAPRPLPGEPEIAGAADTLKAWIDVLTSIDLHTISNLFPVDPEDRDFNWALHTATDFIRVRSDLGENGLLIKDAAQIFKRNKIEPDRWVDLATLERKVIARLRDSGLQDPQTARREAADRVTILEGTTRVVLLGTPDPSPLAVRILERYSLSIPVEVVIFAPQSLENDFDPWGRPEKIQWNIRPIEIPDPEGSITIAPNPGGQASAATEKIRQFPAPAGVVSVGMGDPEVIPQIRQSLHGIGIGAFDPAGTPAAEHAVASVLRHLRDLLESDSVAAFANILRSADVLDALQADSASEPESRFDPIRLLRKLDALAADHLPDSLRDLEEAITHFPHETAEVRFSLGRLQRWLGRFADEDFGATLPEFLGWAFSGREFRADRPEDASTTEVARLVSDSLDSMDGKIFSSRFKLGPKERLDLLLHLLSSARIASERRPEDIELHGWLELLWENAPHLILTGFNEGKVPQSIVGDHYLPDTARRALGLRDNEERLARDAYLLTALIQSRSGSGKVEILVGASSQSGDPLRPSRLLFRCDKRELPDRALRLFQAPETGSAPIPARMFPWKLRPPPPENEGKLTRVPVTGFGDFLRCPFRFYLRHNLRMREVEVGKLEMNDADFGTMIHEVLRRFGNDAEMRDCDDASKIRDFLLEQASLFATRRFGRNLPVPVLIQFESAQQRLRWVAEKQAALRAEGWKIEHVEWKLKKGEAPWTIDGFPVSGSVDRIDRNTKTGALRILDYKTGRDIAPGKDHLAPTGVDPLHRWEITEDETGRERRWKKLQLPLYLLAVRELMDLDPGEMIGAGYFHIPKARAGCRVELWEELSAPVLEDAESCAQGVIDQIQNGRFWPPRTVNHRYDDFAALLFGDPDSAVDPSAFPNGEESEN